MKKFLVLFDRDNVDEAFSTNDLCVLGEEYKVTAEQRFDQLNAELNEAGVTGAEFLGYCRPACGSEPRDVLLVGIMHDGDQASLCKRLQATYDDFGVDGFFEITKA